MGEDVIYRNFRAADYKALTYITVKTWNCTGRKGV